ncbi:MAG: hypothetical protein LBP76_07605 [Treponema sp.]|jgi:hypothetical protein|nr:hypothetical protein [Treponema sp.]
MNPKLKTALLSVSVCVNTLFLLLLVVSVSRKVPVVSFLDMDSSGTPYTTGSCIVSVPKAGAAMVFEPVELTLKPGDEAALQFSALIGGRQLNVAVEALYDHAVVDIEKSGYGLIIKALAPGTTTLQSFTADGIKDIAFISVSS